MQLSKKLGTILRQVFLLSNAVEPSTLDVGGSVADTFALVAGSPPGMVSDFFRGHWNLCDGNRVLVVRRIIERRFVPGRSGRIDPHDELRRDVAIPELHALLEIEVWDGGLELVDIEAPNRNRSFADVPTMGWAAIFDAANLRFDGETIVDLHLRRTS